MSYCSGCGWKLKESSVFCGGCGQNFGAVVEESGVEKSADLEVVAEEVQQLEEDGAVSDEVDVVEESSALPQENAVVKVEGTGSQGDAAADKKPSKKVWVIAAAAAAVLVFAMVAGVVVVQQHNERERVRIEAEEAELARITAAEIEDARTRFDKSVEIADYINVYIDEEVAEAQDLLSDDPNVGEDVGVLEDLQAAIDELNSLRIEIPPMPETADEIHIAASNIETSIKTACTELLEKFRTLDPELVAISADSRLASLFDDLSLALDRVHDAIDAEEVAEAERQAEAERRAAEEAQRQGVERLRRGDISHLAGTWVNEYGSTFTINDDGIIDRGDGVRTRISFGCSGVDWISGRDALIDSHGRYLDASEGPVCVMAFFFPVGVSTYVASNGWSPETDTSRERLAFGHDWPQNTRGFFFRR